MKFKGKLGLQQRVLPSYRVPFFDVLASRCEGGLSLFAGQPRPEETIVGGETRIARHVAARNIHCFRGAFYLCWQTNLIRWLEECDPDILILEANPRYLASSAAARWMRRRGRRTLGWGLGFPSATGRGARTRALFLNQFDGMIAYSQRGADEYAALGFPRERIFIARNSVTSPPPPLTEKPPTFAARPTILFVGRLQARKRVDSLIRACAEIESQPRLIVVGEGGEREALQRLAREIYPTAEFVGAKHGAELIPYFQAADLFVLPGTGGLAVQEAMSNGLPIIVAKGDGTQDDLVGKKNGWLIEPESDAALSDAIKNALSDAARLREMGRESFRIVAQEINIETMADAFVQALTAVSSM